MPPASPATVTPMETATQDSRAPAQDALRRCKILATIGPASDGPERLKQLLEVGVDGFRLNFSHGDHETHRKRIQAIRQAEAATGRFVPILADLQGPKIRVSTFEDDGKGEGIDLRWNQEVTLELSREAGRDGLIRMPHPEIFAAIQPGDVLKLDDGLLQITVTATHGERATARVDVPGRLTNRKGVNIPTRHLPISALTDKDRADMEFALSEGVEIIALSFVQKPEDVAEAKRLINGRALVLSKIEKPLALDAIEAITELSDAIMVARGDLGVELPTEHVPAAQRKIIRACRKAGKPVVVATQMLQSMVDTPVPTRAEASDVATAVYLGADAVMLSAESAVGRHPASAVAVMDRIIRAVEADPDYWSELATQRRDPIPSAANALCASARYIAQLIDAKAIFAFTRTGSSAYGAARERPRCPVYALTPERSTARQLALTWGIVPTLSPDLTDANTMMAWADDFALSHVGAAPGDAVVALAGAPFGVPGTTNMLEVMRISARK